MPGTATVRLPDELTRFVPPRGGKGLDVLLVAPNIQRYWHRCARSSPSTSAPTARTSCTCAFRPGSTLTLTGQPSARTDFGGEDIEPHEALVGGHPAGTG